MSETKITPEDFPISKLMANIGRLHATRADHFMDQIGLYRGQAFLLMILSEQEGLTHSEIAEKMQISPAAVTKAIKRMEELNYLQRQPDPNDERVSRVYLKKEGWAMTHWIKKRFKQFEQVFTSSLTPEERQTLVRLLLKVYNGLLTCSAGSEETDPFHSKTTAE